ncbi:MAG TPA: helix-turn-helix domain-containing protein [Candidatus Limnocylindrales bacterium]
MLADAELRVVGEGVRQPVSEDAIWRALASPLRRRLLDALSAGPRTTGELAASIPELSRFAVMQHLAVLHDAGLVLVRRRGRHRFNHLNPVPLRQWYERWVAPLADGAAAELLRLQRHVNQQGGDQLVSTPTDDDIIRSVRIETELRFRCPPERLFRALTEDTLAWFPHTYGEERTRGIVLEQRVGGLHYEDWGDGNGHLYGQVTVWDPPRRFVTRGRLHAGTILDSYYELEADGEETVLRARKVAVGPINEEEARGIQFYGDLKRSEEALRAVVEGTAAEARTA